MKRGYLSEYFEGVALKKLSAVEADLMRSHQHEFNGVAHLKALLGEAEGKVSYPTHFLYLSDNKMNDLSTSCSLTWYDARERADNRSAEYRLYFPDNEVSRRAAPGDLLFLAKQANGHLLALIVKQDSTIAHQLLWLFDLETVEQPGFAVKSAREVERQPLGFAARRVLEQIGIESRDEAPNYLEEMLVKFNGQFPSTADFSAYARSTLPELDGRDNPDGALLAWMEREEILYRTLEKQLLNEELHRRARALAADELISLVQSTLQRRKSRAGSALENHMEQIFRSHRLSYSRTPTTEGRRKPDFILPSGAAYHDPQFPDDRLIMLAAKSTCRDRWRQILNEAARIPRKHLLTLEPGISEHQTDEMREERVQLILPEDLHASYTPRQRPELMNIREFIDRAKKQQGL